MVDKCAFHPVEMIRAGLTGLKVMYCCENRDVILKRSIRIKLSFGEPQRQVSVKIQNIFYTN